MYPGKYVSFLGGLCGPVSGGYPFFFGLQLSFKFGTQKSCGQNSPSFAIWAKRSPARPISRVLLKFVSLQQAEPSSHVTKSWLSVLSSFFAVMGWPLDRPSLPYTSQYVVYVCVLPVLSTVICPSSAVAERYIAPRGCRTNSS